VYLLCTNCDIRFPDKSQRTTEYNAASDVTEYLDENGSSFDYTHDAIGRTMQTDIVAANQVAGHNGDGRGTSRQTFQYDGLSRRVYALDRTELNSEYAENAEVTIFFDSVGRIVQETQKFDNNTRYTSLTTPSGLCQLPV